MGKKIMKRVVPNDDEKESWWATWPNGRYGRLSKGNHSIERRWCGTNISFSN